MENKFFVLLESVALQRFHRSVNSFIEQLLGEIFWGFNSSNYIDC